MEKETEKKQPRGLRIIEPGETLTYKPDPELVTEFTFRRCPDHLKAQFTLECIKDSRSNELDTSALLWKALEYGLLGWSGVFDGKGAEVPFSLQSAKQLETWLLIELRDRINGSRLFEGSSVPLDGSKNTLS